MKKRVFFAFMILVLPQTVFAAERMVLGELFTSTTCPPCVGANANLTALLAEKDYLVAVRYHMYWPDPGNDPFYHYNVGDNSARRAYYGNINAVPTSKCNGTGLPVSAGFVDQMHETPSSVYMKAYASFQPAYLSEVQGSGTAYLELTNETGGALTFILYAALVENDVHYTGTNGDPIHHQVMIDMIPGGNGQGVTLNGNETKNLEIEFAVDDTVPILDGSSKPTGVTHIVEGANCEIVFWCQVEGTQEVLQATVTPLHGALTSEVVTSEVGNQDGKLHPGETVDFFVTLKNTSDWTWGEVTGFLTTEDAKITIVDSTATWSGIEPDGQGRNDADPFQIKLASDGETGYRPDLSLVLKSGKGTSQNLGLEFKVFEPAGIGESDLPFTLNVPSVVKTFGVITFSAPRSAHAHVALFDASGRMASELYDGDLSSGTNLVPIAGKGLSEGVYFVKVDWGSLSKLQKILVIR